MNSFAISKNYNNSAKQALVFVHGKQAKAWNVGHLLEEKYDFDLTLVFTGEVDFNKIKKTHNPDLLVVMGGPMGVYDRDKPQFSYLNDEIEYIETHLASGKPMLGLCLGSQLMAHTLGAKVSYGMDYGMAPEVGWHEVNVNDTGNSTPVRHFDSSLTKVTQYHQDGIHCSLPDGVELLASSENYPVQAIRYNNSYGLQFHPEGNLEQMTLWKTVLDDHPYGQDQHAKRNEFEYGIQNYLDTMQQQTGLFLDEALNDMALA